MGTPKKVSSNKNFYLEAGASGAGGGTLLILLANNLPDNDVLKTWLVLIAPTTSVVISSFWIWSKSRVEKYYLKKNIRSNFLNAKDTIQEALNNPFTSEDHKKQLRKEIEKLERLAVHIDLDEFISSIGNE